MLACAIISASAACDHRSTISACTDDLSGVWRADLSAGSISAATASAASTSPAHGEPNRAAGRWMILDNRDTLEAYPLFADTADTTGAPPLERDEVLAPRTIDLRRDASKLTGEVRRRVMRRADTCDARGDVVIRTCAADALDLDVADAPLPAKLAPCVWPAPRSPHREHWVHE